MAGGSRRGSAPFSGELAMAGLVLAYGAAMQRRAPAAWEVPANLAAAGTAIALARASGATWRELGLQPESAVTSVRVGLTGVPAIAGVIAAALAVPVTRELLADERADSLTRSELLYHSLVRIPVATAAAEELLFRSALLGVALHRGSPARAVASTAVVFGLWHVLPALRSHDASATRADLAARAGGRGATVVGTIALTAAAGAGLAWLRLRTRNVMAPIVVHTAVNVAALLGARLATRASRRSGSR